MVVEQLDHLNLSVKQFTTVATEQGDRLITLSEGTERQTDELITLTQQIRRLTKILGGIAVLQLIAMVWQILAGG